MRWIKLLRDIGRESGRAVIILAAVAFALFAVATMLGTYGIVTREVRTNYISTNPASATIDVDAVTPEILAFARAFPGIADVEARAVVEARVKVGDEWMRMLLFVADDLGALRMNLATPVSGQWPPADGSMFVEKVALPVIGATEGRPVTIKTPHGPPTSIPVVGTVHDTTLAPAWQEQTGYGYISRATLGQLGEPPVLDELRILVGGDPDQATVDAISLKLADALRSRGVTVHAVNAPRIGEHPHQGQITTGLLMFLSFAVLALILAAILVGAVIAASLARQAREIGVMKAIGARSTQIGTMYAALLLALGAAALVVSLPLGTWAAPALSAAFADTMNFTITNAQIPAWVYASVVAAGLLLPLLAALAPIIKASRTTVREAISDMGQGGGSFSTSGLVRGLAWLGGIGMAYRLAVRNAFRRPGRLALALAMLATSGGLFITALSVRDGWRDVAGAVLTDRHYDLEFTFMDTASQEVVANALTPLGNAVGFELWGYSQSSFGTQGQVDLMRTYPDGGHGSFAIYGVPDATTMVSFPVLRGRWLEPGDTDDLVLGAGVLRQHPEITIGDKVTLSVDGKPAVWRLVGIVREVGGGDAFVSKAAYDRIAGIASGGRVVRVALKNPADAATARAAEANLTATGVPLERAAPLTTLYVALVGHVEVPVRMIVAAAVLLGIIGGLGLASMTTINVLERTRELGIMKAVGAVPGTIVRIVLGEAVVTAVLSLAAAVLVALPLVYAVGQIAVGFFGAPLPFSISFVAILLWLLMIVAIAILAALTPALRASRLIVREALAYT